MTVEIERKLRRKIIQNSVICSSCNEEVYSGHVHDYKQCKCGAIAVDGGTDYLRRVGNSIPECTDTSMTMFEEHVKEMVEAVDWAKDTKRNSYGIALAVIRSLRKNGYLNEDKFTGWDH